MIRVTRKWKLLVGVLLILALVFALEGAVLAIGGDITVQVCVKASDGTTPLSGAKVYCKLGCTYDFGTTDGTGCVRNTFPAGTTNLEVWVNYNNTGSARVTQDISSSASFDFQTDLMTLRLETCYGVPLAGGSARYGVGSTYSTWWFPGGATGSSGEAYAEFFPGTYSFEMQYQGTAEVKSIVALPAESPVIWKTTKVTLNYFDSISYGGSAGDSRWFNKPSMELLPGTYKFHFRNGGGRHDLTIGGCEVEKTVVVLKLKDHSGNPLSGGKARGGNGSSYWQWHVPGSTDANGILVDIRDGSKTTMSYEMGYNNTTQHKTQDVSTNSVFEFQTDLITLRLETCYGVPLAGGSARYGVGSTYTSWWFPGGATGSNGEAYAEFFPGTYSFEMQYQGTAEVKSNVALPAESPVIWKTTKVTLNYPDSISYGGPTGDSRWFNKPSMELLPGTYKFHFRGCGRLDLTFSGCEFTYTYVDTTPPVITTCASDTMLDADADCRASIPDLTGEVVASDNCGGTPTVTQDPAAGTERGVGVHPVTLTVTDGAGNSSSCQATVTIVDSTPPEITCPADVTADADENCQATGVDLGTAVADDNCDPDPSVTNDAPAVFPLGTTAVTWTATDADGNSSTCTQEVRVIDVTSPMVDITAPEDGGCYTSEDLPDLAYAASDNCDPDLDIVIDGWSEAEGTHTVTVSATDDAGNVGSDTITYTVDDTPPVVNITYPGDGMHLRLTVSIEGTATDVNIIAVSLSISNTVVATSPSFSWDTTMWQDGDYVITLMATDCAGNSASTSVTVTVDNTPPVAPEVTGSEIPGVGAAPGEPPVLRLMGVGEDVVRIQIWMKPPGGSEFVYHGSTVADRCGRWQYEGTITAEGLHSIRIAGHDEAGNWSGWSESYELTISGTTPLEVVAFQEGVEGYSGTTDVTIDAWNASSNYGDDGGLIVRQGDKRAALLRFDLSGIPSGVTTERAVLALYVGWRSNTHSVELSAYELLCTWEESEATWDEALTGQAWDSVGANGVGIDRSGEAVDVKTIRGSEGWITLDITPLLARWVDQGIENHGLIIKGSGTASVEYGFRSSEWWEICRRPRLMITYSSS